MALFSGMNDNFFEYLMYQELIDLRKEEANDDIN